MDTSSLYGKKPGMWSKWLILLFAVAAITLFIIAVVLINHNNRGDGYDYSTSFVQAVTTGPSGTLNCSGVGFKTLQTLKAADASATASANFGLSTVTTLEWMAVSDNHTADGKVYIHLYKNSNFPSLVKDPAFVHTTTLEIAGVSSNPVKMAISRFNGLNTLAVVTSTTSGNPATTAGHLNIYSTSSGTWTKVESQIESTTEIISVSQWYNVTAIVSNGTVKLYTSAVESATFSNLAAVSVSIDGDCECIMLAIGGSGSAYLYKKLNCAKCWEYPLYSYIGTNPGFGAQVSLVLPTLAISDYQNSTGTTNSLTCQVGQCRVLTYNVSRPTKIDAQLLLPEVDKDNYIMRGYQDGLLIYASKKVSHFLNNKGKWTQAYLWNFESSTGDIVVGAQQPLVAVRATDATPAPIIQTYAQYDCACMGSTKIPVYPKNSPAFSICCKNKTTYWSPVC